VVDRDRIIADCIRGYRFLVDLTEEERILAADPHQRQGAPMMFYGTTSALR